MVKATELRCKELFLLFVGRRPSQNELHNDSGYTIKQLVSIRFTIPKFLKSSSLIGIYKLTQYCDAASPVIFRIIYRVVPGKRSSERLELPRGPE